MWRVGPRAHSRIPDLAKHNHTHSHSGVIYRLNLLRLLSCLAIVFQNNSLMHVGPTLRMLLVINSLAQLCMHCRYARFN